MEIGAPIVLDDITFIPIIKHETPREERDYLTLSEALDTDVCKITDKGTEVAHILFQNKGDLPILVEEGEIFQGEGTQDRICVGTIMVEPKATVEVPVKCVHAPHHLSSGAGFGYGGKASRGMLKKLRTMKFSSAMVSAPAGMIDQGKVWNQVAEENATEITAGETQYVKSVKARQKRGNLRSKKVNFPDKTVGVVVINSEGEYKGFEVHRSPRNFEIRKDGLFESLEANISWEKKGKGPVPEPEKKVRSLFKKLTQLKEGKEALNQVEIDGMVINSEGMSGEAYTTRFYSSECPGCNQPKPRKQKCPHCGFEEEAKEEVAYMSLY